jgi:hypothetical protein
VYLPQGGNRNLRSDSIEYKLQSWQDYDNHLKKISSASSATTTILSLSNIMDHTSVIGTLMKVNDYRRMNDGKLILYVQGIERFVINHVHQIVPYGIVQVQLIPDIEELQFTASTATGMIPTQNTNLSTEATVHPKRAIAIVTESWKKWFPYEYSSMIGLPIPPVSNSTSTKSTLSMSDIVGCALAKVVPFVPFDPTQYPKLVSEQSSTTETINNNQWVQQSCTSTDIGNEKLVPYSNAKQQSIEARLLQAGILLEEEIRNEIPLSIHNVDSIDEIETRLWIVLNQYYMKSNTAISPFILGILPPPPVESWPKGFLLEGIANVMERTSISSKNDAHQNNNTSSTSQPQVTTTTTTVAIDFVRVPVHYPSIRRQKRCSYYVAQILESVDPENVQTLRQTLLRIPSITLRLAYILYKLESELYNISSK